MNNKLQNRTLFVAALSVYFGLLIVGAPPVLAQTTAVVESKIKQNARDFLLENLPDFAQTVKLFAIDAKSFSSNPVRAEASYSFALSCSTSLFSAEPHDFISQPTWSSKAPPDLGNKFVGGLLSSEAFSYIGKGGQSASFLIIQEIKDDGLNSTAKFSQPTPEDAQKFVSFYKTAWESWKTQKRNLPEAVIYENTEISSENNQVFIVTRLPRAALDSLVRADEKAN